MNRLKAALVVLAVFVGVECRGESTSIAVLQFQHSQSVPESAAQAAEQFIFSKLASDGRFNVLERSRLDAIQAERSVQVALDVGDKTKLTDLGAAYVVLGELTQAEVSTLQGNGGTRAYKATVTYGLRILDVSTGAITYSAQFSSSRDILGNAFAGFTGDITTPAGALDAAFRLTDKKVDAFLTGAFPVTGIIASIEERGRKGDAAMVLVTLGSADGMPKRAKINAFVTEIVKAGGQELTRKRPLADLALVRTEGDHLSIMKVSKGGAELAAAIDQGSEVKVEIKK